MIKITIDNEEVLCDKNLEISEEMLATSSIILNNVYPKSWENDKDYVSRFYYPKDYSKCLIKDVKTIPQSDGETVKGQNISVNYNSDYKWDFEILGKTTQKTYEGKNLFNVDGDFTYGQNYQVKTVSNGDGTITTTANFRELRSKGQLISNLEGNTDYTLSATCLSSNSDNSNRMARMDIMNGTTLLTGVYFTGNMPQTKSITFTTPSDASNIWVSFSAYANSGFTEQPTATLGNIQFEKGTTETFFEPYTGGQPSPNPSYPQIIDTVSGEQKISINNVDYIINLDNIELCKIEEYQDKIYKDNDKWYLHKEIRHLSLSDYTIWAINDSSASAEITSSHGAFTLPLSENSITDISNNNMLSDKFKYEYNSAIINNRTANSMINNTFCLRQGTNDRIYFRNEYFIGKNVNEIKEILGMFEIYYVLSTPIDTEITDAELLNQLSAVQLNNGANDIVITGDITGELKIHYNYNEQTTTDEKLIFTGVVKNTGNISLNPRDPHYCSVQVLDFKTLLSEGDTLDFVISNKTVRQAIEMVIDAIADYGFVLGNINIYNEDDVIGAYSTLNKTAYDVFQYLTEITQSRWFTRMVDENTIAIDFYDPSLMTIGDGIEYTKEWFCKNQINNMTFNYGTYDYRNKQIMLSDKVYANIDYEEAIIADGFNKNFSTTQIIAAIKKITINGVEKTFTLKDNEEYGEEADFYYTPGTNGIESSDYYTVGTTINITYTPLVKGRQVINNSNEISRIATQIDRKGVISRYEDRNDVLSSEELQMIGETYIRYKGTPEINLNIESNNNIWNVGDVVYFDAPLTELSTTYMVKSKKILIISTVDKVFYSYVLTSSFNAETEINYFDNQRNKNAGNIAEGEYITRNIDIENDALIVFSNLNINEIETENDNVLNSVLDSPLTQ